MGKLLFPLGCCKLVRCVAPLSTALRVGLDERGSKAVTCRSCPCKSIEAWTRKPREN